MKRFFKLLVILSALLITKNSISQPPAQGPLPPGAPSANVALSIIFNRVKAVVQTTLDSVNAKISRDVSSTGIQAHISFSFTTYKPYMTVTKYMDRPNENVVKIPFIYNYDVTGIRYHGLPYFSRKLSQSIDIFVSCDKWFTNQGSIKFTTRADRPYQDANSFAEEALNFFIAHTLSDVVDSKIRQAMPAALTEFQGSSFACNRLGVDGGTAPAYTDGQINFKKINFPISLPAANDVTITLKTIKRLSAHTIRGAVLYNATEDIQLGIYANQSFSSLQLSAMTEGEERTLTMNPIVLGPLGGNASLVLICNIEQQTSFQKDSRFRVFTRQNNFGNGIQKIIVTKTYPEPPHRLPNGLMTKPTERQVNAYEITAVINVPQSVIGKINLSNGNYYLSWTNSKKNFQK